MEPLSLSLDLLQERLGELLVALLLDAQTAPGGYDPSLLLSGFGQVIEAMQQLENDTVKHTNARHAERASSLGKTAYQLLERAAQRLLQSDMNFATPITLLQAGFADWVRRQGGMPIEHIGMDNNLHGIELMQTAQLPRDMTCNGTLQTRTDHASRRHTLH